MSAIEVYADIACPFAHAGIQAVIERRRRRGLSEPRLHVRAWPLEVVNGEAHSGPSLVEEVEAVRTVAPQLFAGFDPARFPRSTLPALEAEAQAYASGAAHGEAFSLAVRDALWEHGLDVSDHDLLRKLASGLDVTLGELDEPTHVMASLEEGRQRGVVGSPHFFAGGRDFFCPSLDITKDGDEPMHVAFDQQGLEELVAAAFG